LEIRLSGALEYPNFFILCIPEHAPNLDEGSHVSSGILRRC
jgi:hypothetical protein